VPHDTLRQWPIKEDSYFRMFRREAASSGIRRETA
jgi:hypothetical protein